MHSPEHLKLIVNFDYKIIYIDVSPFDYEENIAKIFVCGFQPKTTDRDLYDHFNKYGQIKEINIMRDKVTGSNKGYAFVEYNFREDAFAAYS